MRKKKRAVSYSKDDTVNAMSGTIADYRPGKVGNPYVAKKATARRKVRELREKHPGWLFGMIPSY